MNDLNIIAITCNCGNAKYYLERKVQLLLEEYQKREFPEATPPSFYRLYWEHKRIYELRQNQKLQELAEKCKVLDYLQRPNAGSDKVFIFPEIGKHIIMTQDIETILETKPKEVEYLFEQAEPIE
jgi:hypothetical protein